VSFVTKFIGYSVSREPQDYNSSALGNAQTFCLCKAV